MHATSNKSRTATTLRKRSAVIAAALALVTAFALAACTVQQQAPSSSAASAANTQERVSQSTWSLLEQALFPPSYSSSANFSQTEGTFGTPIEIKGMRDHYVDTSKAKTATVLVYMCGSDLESYSAAASNDIREMVDAKLGDNVKVVIETGGAKQWHFTSKANPNVRQRWMIDGSSMYYIGDVGRGSMIDTMAVTDFINWGVKKYPADRYLLVFWDHGGGTIGGYGRDENFPNDGSLSLLDLRTAIANSGVKFDLVGFDACLMGTIETAYALEPVADYLLASEEYEMGDGWSWTGFLSALGANPAIDTVDLGKVAIDDFTSYYFRQRLGEITLSLVDLREVPYVYERMGDFLAAAEQTIIENNSRFNEMSQARTRARSFADGGLDQVDLVDLIQRTNFEGRDALLASVNSCVKYRSATTITGANGLAVYFPCSEVKMYRGTRSILNDIGYVRPTEFYDFFLSVMGGSPIPSSSTSSGLISSTSTDASEQQGSAQSGAASSNTYADSSFSAEEWFQQLFGQFTYDELPSQLEFTYEDGGYVVPMNDTMWNAFNSFHTTVMEEANGGYLMLGRDDVYDQTENGDIVVFYNNEWLTMGGQPVSFFSNTPYEEANGEYSHSGIIPAILNGTTRIEISVYWPPQSQQGDVYTGYVQGYRIADEDNDYTFGRGLLPFEKGNVVTPVFDFYDAQGNYSDTIEGTAITINTPEDLQITYELFDHNTVYFWGTMVTVYGDQIDTPIVSQ